MGGHREETLKQISAHPRANEVLMPAEPVPCTRDNPPQGTGTLSRKSWQQERIRRLARICRCIDRGRANGKRIHEELVWFAWRWRNRCYKADPSRKIRFGYGTLRRTYYRWKHSGGDPQALKLAYWSQPSRAPLAWADTQKLVRASLRCNARSLRAAYLAIEDPLGRTCDAWRHALPREIRKTLVELYRTRRHAAIIERKLEGKLMASTKAALNY